MKVGFVGLGNVGGKLAGSLIRNGHEVWVRDLDDALMQSFVAQGAKATGSPNELAEQVEVVITCLPSPAASAAVMEAEDGILNSFKAGQIWLEMSTTDDKEVKRLGAKVQDKGGLAIDCPVSGGCHRAATGNIAIFAGGDRAAFETVLPLLTSMGRRILHTGPLGSASVLKVVTNYLATANLCSLAEALVVSQKAGMDMGVAYEAIKISSGNSFVHETESQVTLNGSREIHFTMDLVVKDVGLFDSLAQDLGVPLEISPLILSIFKDGVEKFGPREKSPNIIRRIEEPLGMRVYGEGFPDDILDDEPEEPGYEVVPMGRA